MDIWMNIYMSISVLEGLFEREKKAPKPYRIPHLDVHPGVNVHSNHASSGH